MRNVEFILSGQRLSLKNKGVLVSGTKGILQAAFTFSKEWSGFEKVVSFYDEKDTEYQVPMTNTRCVIPDEVLDGGIFKVKVTGTKGDIVLPSTRVVVRQVLH